MLVKDSAPSRSVRSLINVHRKRNQILRILIPFLIIVVPISLFINGNLDNHSLVYNVMYIQMILYFLYVSLGKRLLKDRCPTCKSDISNLPNEKGLGFAQLSNKVQMCPYCKKDFQDHESQQKQVETMHIDSIPSARLTINENRRKDMKKLFVVYLVGIGTVITFLLGIEKESLGISWVFLAAFVLTFLWYGIIYEDKCPNCKEDISNLPNELKFMYPELSPKIKNCPYCGVNFSKSPKEE